MKKKIKEIFNRETKKNNKPLFILEMANNHMGDIEHGLKILREFAKITKKFDFNFAFKFQLRDIAGDFIHPDYKNRLDIKYVKRFKETSLSEEKIKILKKEAERLGFISMCTPFDEKSVDLIEKLDFNIIKIGSCSFTDWPLLERIVKTDKPIIASTGGTTVSEVDNIVSFFSHREKKFAIMHCVGEYPTKEENLQLNQIDYLKRRYPNIIIGFSTHEEPNNYFPIQIAIAKGAVIFERHVAIISKKYEINAYSSTPDQVENWLKAAQRAIKINGVVEGKAPHSEKELADLRQFKRGVFAKRFIKKNEKIDLNNTFLAFPNSEKQLVANEMSKYVSYFAVKNINKNKPIVDYKKTDLREKVYKIVTAVDKILQESKVIVPSKVDLEISHHYGMEKFNKYGIAMITCVNRDYCKKLIIVMPNQIHPTQFHKKKEETFHILSGEFILWLDDKKQVLKPGDVMTIKPGVKHSFTSKKGGILEEISSTHFLNDSCYTDKKIALNKNRKTFVTFWRNQEVFKFE